MDFLYYLLHRNGKHLLCVIMCCTNHARTCETKTPQRPRRQGSRACRGTRSSCSEESTGASKRNANVHWGRAAPYVTWANLSLHRATIRYEVTKTLNTPMPFGAKPRRKIPTTANHIPIILHPCLGILAINFQIFQTIEGISSR